ncbi:nitrate/nitrite transporter NrtS [Devosia sp.]|jgi:hypothetical protein|uniref:nitrate/nitrite transporter NrtS n=1 Tax=Devosia sp. TaxID=1871048 RepID=UPI0037BF7A62
MAPAATELTPLRLAFSRRVIVNSLAVAAVVGTALNLINQGNLVFAGQMPDLVKVVLTYSVPFFVSTYGAWNMARGVHARDADQA